MSASQKTVDLKMAAALLAAGFWLAMPMGAMAVTPVHGGITKFMGSGAENLPPIYGHAYYPKNHVVHAIDQVADKWALQAAEKRYKQVLAKNPHNAMALNGLGKVYYWMTATSNQEIRDDKDSYYAKATDCFLQALSYKPNYVEARLNLGTMYLEAQRYTDAQEEFSRAIELDPKNSEALEKMGVVALRQGQYNDALPWLEKATHSDSSNASAYYHLGVVDTARGEFQKALLALNTSLGLFANSAPVHYQLGQVYDSQGNGAAAVEQYKLALQLTPEYEEASMALAAHYQHRGDDSVALETLKNASEADRHNTALLLRIGDLSLTNHQPEVAEAYYKKTLIEDPDNAHAKQGISDSELAMAKTDMDDHRMMGDWKAKQAVEQSLAYNPKNLDAKFYQISSNTNYTKPLDFSQDEVAAVLNAPDYSSDQTFKKGEMLLDRYRFDQAEDDFKMAVTNAKNVDESVTMGETFLAMGLPDMADAAFHHAAGLAPNHPVAAEGLKKAAEAKTQAQTLYDDILYHHPAGNFLLSSDHRNFDHGDRETMLLEVLRLNVRHAQAHYTLAQLYEDEKRYGEAADQYFAYLQLNPAAGNRDSINKRIEKLQEKMWTTAYETNYR